MCRRKGISLFQIPILLICTGCFDSHDALAALSLSGLAHLAGLLGARVVLNSLRATESHLLATKLLYPEIPQDVLHRQDLRAQGRWNRINDDLTSTPTFANAATGALNIQLPSFGWPRGNLFSEAAPKMARSVRDFPVLVEVIFIHLLLL
ncbi:unnamed protein product [Protopolystoma xenopodis]|uniref:Uncharacterized protein n=1 Tax=Protopolystoma xenopodis TaxID=117903 RepID=A0A448WYQ9_9PLAT|nr:unnamed protein product [Protopolystoma xenopodis]